MPTPSAPNPELPYSFNSTCPDTDERVTPQSPSSWHPPPPPPYAAEMDADTPGDSVQHPAVAEDDEALRSTMSPSPIPSSNEPALRVDIPSPTAQGEHEDEEPRKQSGTDDERLESADYTRPDERLSTARRRQTSSRAAPPRPFRVADVGASSGSPSASRQYVENEYVDTPMMGHGCGSSSRIIPQSPSSFLRPGSKFRGTQQSERQVYDVQVEIKHVDMRESFLCGYLRIQGLTEDHPTLTTYFEGEIIGSKYGFMTKHDDWGATDKIDYSHWYKFPAFKPLSKQVRKGASSIIKNVAQNEHIFMRWKEHFLVPDHRVRTINGASFEGFYYICFNQIQGEINGIYFHSKSERFQQLDLKHVEDRGCFSAIEFR